MHTYTCARSQVHTYLHIHTCSPTYMHTHKRRPIYMHTCALTSAHLQAHACAHSHAHSHTHARHARVPPLACRAHLCGPELQHQSPRLHLLRHAHLLQVQQVTLQPAAPVSPGDHVGWGQQLPEATFDLAHLVFIPCRNGAYRVEVTDPSKPRATQP